MTEPDQAAKSRDRFILLALAACCIGPMIGIVVLTAVVGMAVGPAAAITLGVVAALACVAVMIGHRHSHIHGHGTADH